MLQRIVPTVAAVLGICAFISITAYSIYLNAVPQYTIQCTAYLACRPGEPCQCFPEDYTEMCCGYRIDEVVLTAYIILFALLGSSIWLAVERWVTFYFADRQSQAFKSKATEALFNNRAAHVINLASLYPKSPLAAVVAASLEHERAADAVDAKAIKPSMAARQQALVIKTEELNKGLWNLSAAGWTMALVALLLLVFGALSGLRMLYIEEGRFSIYMARSLADAMWTSVLAILAAVPIIWTQKYFSAKVATFVLEMDKLSLAIIGRITEPQAHRSLPATRRDYVTQPLGVLPTHRLCD